MDQVLEKPRDAADAMRMLGLLSGREHEVITGICLRTETRKIVDVAITRVRFVPLTPEEIEDYVASGEPMDKAGAYAIQGLASKFIDRIEGDYFNVVGLPVALVYRHWKEIGLAAERANVSSDALVDCVMPSRSMTLSDRSSGGSVFAYDAGNLVERHRYSNSTRGKPRLRGLVPSTGLEGHTSTRRRGHHR